VIDAVPTLFDSCLGCNSLHYNTIRNESYSGAPITLVIPEQRRNEGVLRMRDLYAVAAFMPRGKPTRQRTKLFESLWPCARFTPTAHG
jgi:hypothetical protein